MSNQLLFGGLAVITVALLVYVVLVRKKAKPVEKDETDNTDKLLEEGASPTESTSPVNSIGQNFAKGLLELQKNRSTNNTTTTPISGTKFAQGLLDLASKKSPVKRSETQKDK